MPVSFRWPLRRRWSFWRLAPEVISTGLNDQIKHYGTITQIKASGKIVLGDARYKVGEKEFYSNWERDDPVECD